MPGPINIPFPPPLPDPGDVMGKMQKLADAFGSAAQEQKEQILADLKDLWDEASSVNQGWSDEGFQRHGLIPQEPRSDAPQLPAYDLSGRTEAGARDFMRSGGSFDPEQYLQQHTMADTASLHHYKNYGGPVPLTPPLDTELDEGPPSDWPLI